MINDKITALKNIYLQIYKDDLHPCLAADFAVYDFINMCKTQMHYFDKLISDEIEYLNSKLK